MNLEDNNDKCHYPLISVVMLNFNGKRYLERSIPSVLQLSYPNFEFIIVDNGSWDGSREYIKDYARIKLVQSPRVGAKNYACNLAIGHARGEYILLLDNDIILTEYTLLENLLYDYTTLDKAGSLTLAYHHEGEDRCIGYGAFFCLYFKHHNRRLWVDEFRKLHASRVGYPQGIGIFIRKSLWDEVGGYDPYLSFGGDDKDLGLRLWQCGYNNYLYARSVHVHTGMPERTDNKKYRRKFHLHVFSDLYTITKNFRVLNALTLIAGYSAFMFLKSVKQSVERRHVGVLLGYFTGWFRFIISVPHAMKMRRGVQSGRTVMDDVSLRIKPPMIKKAHLIDRAVTVKVDPICERMVHGKVARE